MTETLSIVRVRNRDCLVWRSTVRQEAGVFEVTGLGDRLPVFQIIGKRVQPSAECFWGDQGGAYFTGTVVGPSSDEPGWVDVVWDGERETQSYRWGADGIYDLDPVPEEPPPVPVREPAQSWWSRLLGRLRVGLGISGRQGR
jgi:hypothetical protein